MKLVSFDILNDVNCYCYNFIHCEYRLQHHCCGVNSPADWRPIYGDKLPFSCCPEYWLESDSQSLSAFARRYHPGCSIESATKVGCKEKLVQFVKEFLIVWIALGFTLFILVQVKKSVSNQIKLQNS